MTSNGLPPISAVAKMDFVFHDMDKKKKMTEEEFITKFLLQVLTPDNYYDAGHIVDAARAAYSKVMRGY